MLKKIISIALLSIIFLSGCSAQVYADNLMRDITPSLVTGKESDDIFTSAVADFYIELFKKTFSEESNSLISPASVLLALAMTANGADYNTLAEIEKVICGNMAISELNGYLFNYVKNLPGEKKSRLNIANSIWFKDDNFTVNKDFLQTNADYYGASAYKAAFDSRTVEDINNWTNRATDGLIDKIIEEISDEVMYLINTVLFDAEWMKTYDKEAVRDGQFTAYNNIKQTIKFMHSSESLYFENESAQGFIKPYYGNNYSFVAILPNKNISVGDYVNSLTGKKFMNLIKSASAENVEAALPKFSYEYSAELNEALISMGIKDAFCPDNADFSKIGDAGGNLFISKVMHKTYIKVDELGTKAGAVTAVSFVPTSAPLPGKKVILDRPFIYAIIDNATKLPIFTGTLTAFN